MASLISDDQSSTISTDASNTTELSSLFRMSGANPQSPDGTHEETTDDVDDAYKGINWSKLEGYTMAPHSKRQHISWTWEHGYRIQNMNSQIIFWLCKICIQRKANRNTMYNIAGGSHSQIRHLRDKHNLDANGPIQKKRRLTFNGDTSTAGPIEQALVNQRISDFSPERFKTALLRWMAYANISFRQVELPQFHELLQEAYAEIGTAGCLPTAHTLVSWIKRDFHHYKAVVVEQLQEVEGHIHFTFDLWTAGNLLSLNGVFAHFLDPIGKKKKILLSIPSINGSHTGEAIADGVGEIIKEFGLEKRVGYFVLDNAGNNNTGVEELGRMFGFNPSKRRLRCTAHIVNLVATQIMYGKDLRAFETEGDAPRALQDDLELWRRKGALGKLRNIIMWITDRHAGGGRAREFKSLQIESQNCLLDDEPRRPPAELKRPNDTRWNSHYYAFETAVLNRAPIDAYSEKEERAHNTRLERVTQKNRRLAADKHITLPAKPLIVEDKMSTEDWVTVTRYMEILKPLMLVTKKLEGYPRQGRNGLMWEVLPCYEFLLNHLERLMEQYRHDPDEDLKLNIQLGWQKLNEYYTKLDDTEVYVAAVALHPQLRLTKIKQLWADRADDGWICRAEQQLHNLWQQYRDLPLPEQPHPEAEDDILDEILNTTQLPSEEDLFGPMAQLGKKPAQPPPPLDEMDEFQGTVDTSFANQRDPVSFWVYNRPRWPRLARMALDIYGIPPTEADNERLYSRMGDMVTKKRNRLSAATIGAIQCLRQWDEDEIIIWRSR